MLTLNHLNYFCDAADFGSLTEAAKRHRVSSSAVSLAIRALETHFGETLLTHAKNRFQLTDAGEFLRREGRLLLRQARTLEGDLAAHKKSLGGQLTFATQQSFATTYLAGFLVEFAKAHPLIKTHIRLVTTGILRGLVTSGEVDFGISVDDSLFENLNCLPIMKGNFVLACAQDKVKEAKTLPFLVTATNKASTRFRTEYFRIFQREVPTLFDIDSWGAAKAFAEHGHGIAFIPDYLLKRDLQTCLRPIRLPISPIPYEVGAYYSQKRGSLPRVCQVFLEHLLTYVHRRKP